MEGSGSSKKVRVFSVSLSQDELWMKFREGDRDAFGKIYRAHIDELYHYGMHFCRDSERVKDCLQDLFRDLWLEREHLSSGIQHVRYYLLISLRRRLLRSLQKDRKHYADAPAETYDFELIPPHENEIIRSEIHRERAAQLHRSIDLLSRRQREAIYLRFFQNLSYQEIADIMSMKIDSVYNIISKAIGLLKNMLMLVLLIFLLKG